MKTAPDPPLERVSALTTDLGAYFGAPGKAWRFQRVRFPHRQGESHLTGNRALG